MGTEARGTNKGRLHAREQSHAGTLTFIVKQTTNRAVSAKNY